jgi:serine/threonine-protein kinase
MDSYPQFLYELRRRSVFKVAVAYVVSAWLFVQVASIIIPAFEMADWVMRALLIAVAAGFPAACILAWAYELTAEGIRRESPDEGRSPSPLLPEHAAFGRLASWESLLVVVALSVAIIGGVTSIYATRFPDASHLAVLPFRVVNTEPEAEILAAGLVETLTSTATQFSQFENTLWVVPASEITEPMTPSAARQRFGVSVVVSGSIQFDDERVRLTLNLIDAETERQIQSQQVDVQRQGLMELQDEATRRLASMLDLRLTADQTEHLARGRTTDREAGRHYVQGRGTLRRAASIEDVDAAIVSFRRALEADSGFARSHAGLGEAYWQKYRRTEDVQWVDAALHHSRQALALDSTLAPAWVTLGIIRSDQRHDEAAVEAFTEAIAIDPRYAETYRHLARVYRNQGDWAQAEATYRQAIARQPEYWKGYNGLGVFYYSRGRFEEAAAQYTHGLRLAPANPSLLNNMAVVYWQMQRMEEAMTVFERILRLDSTRTGAQYNLATTYFYLGRYDDAVRLYTRVLAQRPKDYALVGALADAQMWSTDQRDRAPDSYRRAIQLATEHLSFRGQDPLVVGSLAQYYARLQREDSARVWLRRVEPLVDSSDVEVALAFGIGELYESLGEREQALAWIHRALDQGYGWIPLKYSPWLAGVRDDASIRPLLNQSAP